MTVPTTTPAPDANRVKRYADLLREDSRSSGDVNWGFAGLIGALADPDGFFPGGDAERLAHIRAALAARQQVVDELRAAR